MKKTSLLLASLCILSLLYGTVFAETQYFKDVDENHANYLAITFVKEEGIVEGYSDNTYRPSNEINRAEFTKIIIESLFEDDEINNCDLSKINFSDVKNGDWYAKYVCLAERESIIEGYDDGTFRANNPINFVESAKIVSLAYKLNIDESEENPWYKKYVDAMANEKFIPTTIDSFNSNITRGEMAEIIYRKLHGVYNQQSHTYETLASSFKVFENRKWKGTVTFHEINYYKASPKSYTDTNVTYEFTLQQNDIGEVYVIELKGSGTEEEKIYYSNGNLESEYYLNLTYNKTYTVGENLAGFIYADGAYDYIITPIEYFGNYVDEKFYKEDGTFDYTKKNFVSFLGTSLVGNSVCEEADFSDHYIDEGPECLKNKIFDNIMENSFEDEKYNADYSKDGIKFSQQWRIEAI